jgi:hypothetical protein
MALIPICRILLRLACSVERFRGWRGATAATFFLQIFQERTQLRRREIVDHQAIGWLFFELGSRKAATIVTFSITGLGVPGQITVRDQMFQQGNGGSKVRLGCDYARRHLWFGITSKRRYWLQSQTERPVARMSLGYDLSRTRYARQRYSWKVALPDTAQRFSPMRDHAEAA